MGAPKLFPPLAGSDWVEADPEAAIRIVLHGLDGPLEVNGERFMNKMAPLGHVLTDEEIADILTYVRASWGNAAEPVSPEEVARVREATRERETEWTEAELRGLLDP